MADQLTSPLSYFNLAINNNRTKCCRLIYLFTIVIGVVILFFSLYGTLQWKIPNNRLLSSENILINTKKTKPASHNRLKRFGTSDYYFDRYQNDKSFSPSFTSSTVFNYSEEVFRSSSSPPILWLDSHGDVRWNKIAEREMYFYLLNKQTIDSRMTDDDIIDECLRRPLFILRQHKWGFFSRVHCFIEQFGQSLYSPWMTIMSFNRFRGSKATVEDFLGEGILRYIEPVSTCTKYVRNPRMKLIDERLHINENNDSQKITDVHQLLYEEQLNEDRKYSILDDDSVWLFGYEHIPLRRWMFGHNQFTPTYNLSIEFLTNHTAEHIYKAPSLNNVFLTRWTPRNQPIREPSQHLPGQKYRLTWQDRVFTAFLRYMFVLYFHQFAPRIHQMTHLLAEHWSSYLMDKNRLLSNNTAAIHIRRGDKASEDSFWKKYRRWRNISMYVKGLVDEEQRLNRTFSSIFVVTDDIYVMKSMEDYTNPHSNRKDELYARKHLKNRHIIYNVFAPQACLDPGSRTGFDQFLVSLQFIIQYAEFTITHSDSNIGRYLEEIIYGRQQLKSSVHSDSFVKNAPDSL
jgi:hypothetical protein